LASHARATAKSRWAVRSEIPIACADSSTVKPMKYHCLTSSALRASWAAKLFQRLVQYADLRIAVFRRGDIETRGTGAEFFECASWRTAACAGHVDQNNVACLGCRGEEMRPILPLRLSVAPEPEPYFMHERRGLKGLAWRLAAIFAAASFRSSS
jgi:hypothetical protein